MGTTNDFGMVARHRPYLVRRARMHIHDADLAEDVVQEVLIAAFRGHQRFAGRSSVRTWLVGILQHKIVDAIRDKARRRETRVSAHRDEAGGSDDGAGPMHAGDHRPGPEAQAEARELFTLVERHLATLPARSAAAFVMRDLQDHTSADVCAALGITSSNLFVMLHRTRKALRHAVHAHGYDRRP